MTKDEVKQAFKTGKGNIIAQAMKDYFTESIANGTVKPLQYYKPGEFQEENNIRQNEKKDIVTVAQGIFGV